MRPAISATGAAACASRSSAFQGITPSVEQGHAEQSPMLLQRQAETQPRRPCGTKSASAHAVAGEAGAVRRVPRPRQQCAGVRLLCGVAGLPQEGRGPCAHQQHQQAEASCLAQSSLPVHPLCKPSFSRCTATQQWAALSSLCLGLPRRCSMTVSSPQVIFLHASNAIFVFWVSCAGLRQQGMW